MSQRFPWAAGRHGLKCYITAKPVLSGHSKEDPKICFQDRKSIKAGQKYSRMLLQYIQPALSL